MSPPPLAIFEAAPFIPKPNGCTTNPPIHAKGMPSTKVNKYGHLEVPTGILAQPSWHPPLPSRRPTLCSWETFIIRCPMSYTAPGACAGSFVRLLECIVLSSLIPNGERPLTCAHSKCSQK